MTTRPNPPRLHALTKSEFEELRTTVHADFGEGFALYEKLSKQFNTIRNSGLDILSNAQLRIDLTNARADYDHGRGSLAEKLPAYKSYRKVIDEYNLAASASTASASQPDTAKRDVDSDRTSRSSAQASQPVVEDRSDELEPASQPVRPPEPEITKEASDRVVEPVPADLSTQLDAAFERHLKPVQESIDKHETTLYGEHGDAGLVKRVEDLEAAMPRGANDEYSFEAFRNTVQSRGLGSVAGTLIGTFIVTFLLVLALAGLIGWAINYGYIAAMHVWTLPAFIIALVLTILVALNIHRSITASAVTREERI